MMGDASEARRLRRSDQPSGSGRTTDDKQEWKPISQGGKRGEPHDICTDEKNVMLVGASHETVKAICDSHNAELAAEREKVHAIEAEEIRRIRHLNRLGSWAQQDPTGPTKAGRIQEWVLAELKAALGSEYKPTEWQPEFLKLKDQLAAEHQRRVQAELDYKICCTMRDNHSKQLEAVLPIRLKLERQLLSALAAIEHVRKREGCIVTDERLAQIIDNVELSALREHDAELIKKDRKSRPRRKANSPKCAIR